jgi:hypothetical protein
MRLEEAEELAWTLMGQHFDYYRLDVWKFKFDNAKTRCGCTHWGTETITLSRNYVKMNEEAMVRDTILHEIAHVLVGPRAGHGPEWQAKAIEVGARPKRCKEAEMPKGRYVGTCEGCNKEFTKHRMGDVDAEYQHNQCKTLGRAYTVRFVDTKQVRTLVAA